MCERFGICTFPQVLWSLYIYSPQIHILNTLICTQHVSPYTNAYAYAYNTIQTYNYVFKPNFVFESIALNGVIYFEHVERERENTHTPNTNPCSSTETFFQTSFKLALPRKFV